MIQRKFMFRGEELPDPDPDMNPVDVKELYSNEFPELVNAAIVYNDPIDGVQEFGFAEKSASAQASSSSTSKPTKTQTVEFKPSIGRKG